MSDEKSALEFVAVPMALRELERGGKGKLAIL